MYDIKEFHFNPKECWFKNFCSDYGNPELCHCACPEYIQFYYLVNMANIPPAKQYKENLVLEPGLDKNEHEYLKGIQDNIVNWVKQGNNLYLFSEQFGNGKTTWAIKIMLQYFFEIYPGNGIERCRGLFLNVDQFLRDMRNNINKKDKRFTEMCELIPTVDLIIWDDIGCRQLSDYEFNTLYTYINERMSYEKSNIFTSNVIDEGLVKNIGGRLADRILNTSDIVEFINPSQRKPARERGRK